MASAGAVVSQRSADVPKPAGSARGVGGPRAPADLNSVLSGAIAELAGPRTVYVVSEACEAPSEYANMGGPEVIGVYRTLEKAKSAL